MRLATGENLPCWRIRVGTAALWLAVLTGFTAWTGAAAETYTFAVTPQFEQRKLFSIWKPIVDELEARTGLHFQLVAGYSIPGFERELEKGAFDFIYANPYHVMRLSKTQGYIPLVRDAVPLRGVLVVRKDSQIRKLSELNNQEVAFPTPNALGASLLMRAELFRLHHVEVKPLYVKTHSSVYIHVVNGLTVAGGGVEKTLQEQDPAIRDALRVLYVTREMPSLPVAAHPRVPPKDREKVRKALLQLGATQKGRELLAEVPMTHPVATSLEDYLPMRDWDLESFWVTE